MQSVPPGEIAFLTSRNDGRVSLVHHNERVGAAAFTAAIEWYWYAPGTPRNRFFDCYHVRWEDIDWIVTVFPIGRLDACRRLARQLGVRIANGTPRITVGEPRFIVAGRDDNMVDLREGGLTWLEFPGTHLADGTENLRMFAIENDDTSPVYKASRRDLGSMGQATTEINAAFQRGIRLTPAQIADYIYGPSYPVTR